MQKITLIICLFFYVFVGYAQFPQNFEAASITVPNGFPSGWLVTDNGVGGTTNWEIQNSPSVVINGTKSAYINRHEIGAGNTSEDWLISPATLIPVNGQLRFLSKQTLPGDNGTIYQIRISTGISQNNLASYTVLQEWNETQLNQVYNVAEEKAVDLPNATIGTNVYIAFVRVYTQPTSVQGGDRWIIDDIKVESKCLNPNNLTASSITSTSAILNWTYGSSSSNFELEIIPANTNPAHVASHIAEWNPYVVTGLLPNTCYKFYIRSTCSPGITSDWTGPFNFCTFPTGVSCTDPIMVSTLPYQSVSNTNNFGNLVSGPQSNSCISGAVNYQSGNDVFYSYTATEDTTLRFTLTSAQPRSSMFIYSSCSGITGNCLAAIGNTTNSQRNLNLSVMAGSTYIIMISSSLPTASMGYDFSIQEETCPAPPTNLTVLNTTSSGAQLSWNAPSFSGLLGYEVAVQPQGSPVPSGLGQYTSVNPSITISNLSANTAYQYWVRTECAPGQYSTWAGPVSLTTATCEPEDQCTYIFRMEDTAGNGWNGARMQIRQNGIILQTIGSTFVLGSGPIDIPIVLCNGLPFEVYWSMAGTQPQQCVLRVLNSFGQTLSTISGNASTVNSTVFSGTVNCETPVCFLSPTNVSINNVTYNSATINWEAEVANNVAFDIYIAATGSLPPTVSTTPTYVGVTGSVPFSFAIPTPNNLLQDTFYDVYVRVQCEPNDSPWSIVQTFKTEISCPQPINQTVTGITLNSAVLGWTETASATQWEVLVLAAPNGVEPAAPLATPIVGINDIFIQNITGATTTTPTLQPATIYYYYVRSVCQSDSDKSLWTGPFIFNTNTCEEAQKCTFKFMLTHPLTNSWNDARMQVRQNGIVVATLGTGGINNPNGIAISICNNVPFDLYWSEAGSLPEQIGVSIIDTNNDVVFTKLAGQGTPLTVLYSDIILGNCEPSTCPKPVDLLATASQTSAQLSWTETGTANQWEVFVAANGMAQPVNGGPIVGNAPYYLTSTSTNFPITDLQPGTGYTCYVRSVCSANDISTWTILNPVTFATIPLNDECAAAINIPVSLTWGGPQWIAGNTLGSTASAEFAECPGSEDDDVWFSFVAINTVQVVQLKNVFGSTANLRFSVYSGSECESMTLLLCSGTNSNIVALSNLVVGQVYKIRVYTNSINSNLSASFEISVTSPPPSGPNDEPINAIPVSVNYLSECVYSVSANLVAATATPGLPETCAGIEDDDIWFSFVATSGTHIINLLNVEGTTTTLNHSIFSGTYDNLVQLYCAPANALISSNSSYVIGQAYFIRVWSAGSINEIVTFNLCIKPVSSCATAAPFCGGSLGNPYIFPNTIGIPNATQVACLESIPNPTYYTLNVSETGPLQFTIFQNTNILPSGQLIGTNLDIDFVVWGPFSSPESCDQIIFSDCPTCPNNTVNPNFYPLGNIVDCSYSASFTETVSIPNAQAGEYYVMLLTNFNGSPGYISLMQDNYDDVGAGATSCGDAIQLVAFVDANNNGTKDDAESTFTSGSFTFQKNNTGNTYYIANPMGVQNIYDANTTNTYDFNYEIHSEYTPFYAETATNFNDLNIPFGSGIQTLYFPITVTQTYNDISVSIIPFTTPRPGFSYIQKIVYSNLGLVNVSGTLTFTKGNPAISIVEVLPAATNVTAGGFTYDYINLAPGETRFIDVKMYVPTIPIVALGDVASTAVSISSPDVDINTNNNSFVANQVIVGSYDPNDKNEARGATVNINQFTQDDYLFYTIRFQNTGTASAETVRIEDLLSSQFDYASIRMISASHHYSMERINNKLVWTFNNINLVSASQNELLSQGYVFFKIKLNPSFAVGDVIENTAEIYFDFNPPIITNTFATTFVPNLSVGIFEAQNLVIYPNPAKEIVQISMVNSTATLTKIVIYDIIGKEIKTRSGNNSQQATINVSDLARGVYMIEITTDSNLKQTRKFIVN